MSFEDWKKRTLTPEEKIREELEHRVMRFLVDGKQNGEDVYAKYESAMRLVDFIEKEKQAQNGRD